MIQDGKLRGLPWARLSAASQSWTHRYGFIVCPASKGRSVAASQTVISVLTSA